MITEKTSAPAAFAAGAVLRFCVFALLKKTRKSVLKKIIGFAGAFAHPADCLAEKMFSADAFLRTAARPVFVFLKETPFIRMTGAVLPVTARLFT